MELKTYLSTLPRGSYAEFAARVGIDRVYLSQIASRKGGERTFVPSPALAVRIEQASGSQVTRRDLRPDDWVEIWPELVDSVDTCRQQPKGLDGAEAGVANA